MVLAVHNGTPVLVKDVGRVEIGIAPRLGEFGYEKQDDAVEGVILMRTGEKTQDVLKRVEAKTKELNEQILPKDVKVVPFYDRSDLIALTTQVVEHNLLRGMLLVVVVLIFFLYDFRAGLIVAITIPLALLFAFVCLDLQNASANLLSIGAIDFGILVDGAVFMVENIFRQIAARKGTRAQRHGNHQGRGGGSGPPAFLCRGGDRGQLPAHLCPVRTFGDAVQADGGHDGLRAGRLPDRHPDPAAGVVRLVHARGRDGNGATPRSNTIKSRYIEGLDFCLARPWGTTFASAVLLAGSLLLIPFIGAEFMPQLDEGALWVRATMPYTISFDESAKIAPKVRDILRSFPEVTTVASELGRPDDGTDPTGFFNVEFYVGLKPYAQWTGSYRTKAELIEAINQKLQAFPGIIFNYTQPAEDAVDEAETGLKSALAVKVFGSDLNTLQQKGKAIKQVLEQVRGIRDVTLVQELGQPSLTINIDRAKIARYGLNVADINGLIQTAIGGDVATQVVQGEKAFDLVVRLDRQYRDNPEEIGNIPVATPGGQQIPLKEFADIQVTNGASFIYRENNSRYIGVQFSVEGRDLAGAVEDAIKQVNSKVALPQGYRAGLGRRIHRIHRVARSS